MSVAASELPLVGAGPRQTVGRRVSTLLYRHGTLLTLLLLGLPLAWLGIVYLGSLLSLLVQSFFAFDDFSGQVVHELTLRSYLELLTNRANIDIILRTVCMAAAVTLGAALIGFPIAYVMARYATGRAKALFYLAVMLPLWSSYLVRVYAWKLILAKEGVISWAFAETNLAWLLNGVLALPVIGGPSLSVSYLGMFLVFTYIWLPFMILPTQAALERVPNGLIEASADLGARPVTTFRTVILPLALPGRGRGLDLHLLAHAWRLHHPVHHRQLALLHRPGGVRAPGHRGQHPARRRLLRRADRDHGGLSDVAKRLGAFDAL